MTSGPHPASPRSSRAAWSLVFGGALVHAATQVAGRAGVEPFASWFYILCWWSYVALADGLVHLRTGESLLLARPRAFLLLALHSAGFWLLFELANLRLANWYYVGVPPDFLSRGPGTFVAFATVLPGILETESLLASFGLFARTRCRPWRIGPRLLAALTALGVLSLVLPLAFPRYAYPLIWGFAALLAEPWLFRRGERCLLRQLADGDPRFALRLLAAGLACGLLWETWNDGASAKWIYTVPFFDEAKLFEMPFAGFLGFPPFALECYVFARFAVATGLVPEWERGEPERAPRRRRETAAALLVLAASAPAIWAVNAFTVRATRPSAAELAALSSGEQRLAGVASMGLRGVRWLEQAGVRDERELAACDPDELLARLTRAEGPDPPPSPAEVRVWVRAARRG